MCVCVGTSDLRRNDAQTVAVKKQISCQDLELLALRVVGHWQAGLLPVPMSCSLVDLAAHYTE